MMDCTDRHFRQLIRCISRYTWLYTEMITAHAVIHGDRERLLGYHGEQHPLALQLGGSDPEILLEAAKLAEDHGYDEVNINVGCPSDRVKSGNFGACLMKQPDLVARCVERMREGVHIPVTVKTRIGVDDEDSYELLHAFVNRLRGAGCQQVMVHARKAWLKGLSPRQNRDIPPLRYEIVYQLKQDFPDLHVGINGGVMDADEARAHLRHVDEVMIGRAVCQNPYLLSEVDRIFYNSADPIPTPLEAIQCYLPYVQDQLNRGERLRPLLKPLVGFFQGMKGARSWRRILSEWGGRDDLGVAVIERALCEVVLR